MWRTKKKKKQIETYTCENKLEQRHIRQIK